jgi:P4 family phage/plasmid primase-like protien
MLKIDKMKELEKIGLSKKSKNGYEFNENKFVETFLEKNDLRRSISGFLKFQSDENYWKELGEDDVKKLALDVFCGVDKYIRKTSYENRYFPLLQITTEKIEKLNPYIYKTNFINGVYNFETHILEEHCKENYFTYRKNYGIYEEMAETPVFDKFVDQITLGRADLKEYLLTVLAYLVSGDRKLQKFFILKGGGANGKSTLISLLSKIIGDKFVTSISLSKLNEKFALSSVVGKRLIIASENECSQKISTETIKKLTGDDLVEIEQKYKDRYSDKLQVETLFAINNEIQFSENSYGLKRRLVVIPFDYRIKEAEMDFDLEKKLEVEIPDIMRKFIGIHFNFANGGYRLPYCKDVEEAKKKFLDEGLRTNLGEGIFDFLEENLVIDPEGRISKKELYKNFKNKTSKYHTTTKFWQDFNKWSDYRDISVVEIKNGERFKTGIAFKNRIDEDEKPGLDIF